MTRKSRNNGHADNPQAIAKIFDALPPHSAEAEAAVLGSLILDAGMLAEVVEIIPGPEAFYSNANAAVYQAILDLSERNTPPDIVAINDRLKASGLLDQIGGTNYLIELADSVPFATHAGHYAKTVSDMARRRAIIEASTRTIREAHESSDTADDILDRHEQNVFEITDRAERNGAVRVYDELQSVYDVLSSGENSQGISTGFLDLDKMTGGLHPGELIIGAARPSIGKTALATSIVLRAASTDKTPAAIFSLEMSRRELTCRLLSAMTSIPLGSIRKADLHDDDFARIAKQIGGMSDCPLFIDDTPGMTLMQLRTKARRMVARHGVKLIAVDYLQLMRAPGTESRLQEVSELSRGLKLIAKELNIPIVCLSQLNRQAEHRQDHRPKLSDLRESGTIEQDADVVILLHRADYYAKPNDPLDHTAELIVAKQRNGPTGTVHSGWNGPTATFTPMRPEYA